jgi:hypothetical protein
LLRIWEDTQIVAGETWRSRIEEELEQSKVAVLLISSSFLTSDFIQREEIPRLLQRRERAGLRIIPLLVRPCAWDNVGWLKPIECRPKSRKFLSRLKTQSEDVLAALAREISRIVKMDG